MQSVTGPQKKNRFKSDLETLERILAEAGIKLVLKGKDFCTWKRRGRIFPRRESTKIISDHNYHCWIILCT